MRLLQHVKAPALLERLRSRQAVSLQTLLQHVNAPALLETLRSRQAVSLQPTNTAATRQSTVSIRDILK
jgi:hypothetical protein